MSWKNPDDQSVSGSGPAGMIWKYRSYLNVSFAASPNSDGNTSFFLITIGNAGAIRLVP